MRRGEKPTMKYIYVFICALVFLVDFGMNNQKFFPNLPTVSRTGYQFNMLDIPMKSSEYSTHQPNMVDGVIFHLNNINHNYSEITRYFF